LEFGRVAAGGAPAAGSRRLKSTDSDEPAEEEPEPSESG